MHDDDDQLATEAGPSDDDLLGAIGAWIRLREFGNWVRVVEGEVYVDRRLAPARLVAHLPEQGRSRGRLAPEPGCLWALLVECGPVGGEVDPAGMLLDVIPGWRQQSLRTTMSVEAARAELLRRVDPQGEWDFVEDDERTHRGDGAVYATLRWLEEDPEPAVRVRLLDLAVRWREQGSPCPALGEWLAAFLGQEPLSPERRREAVAQLDVLARRDAAE